jgi:hypothetical protein
MKNPFSLLFHLPLLGLTLALGCQKEKESPIAAKAAISNIQKTATICIDTADCNRRMRILNEGTSGKWKNKCTYSMPGAILPYKRVVAFYGNLYSKRMGILGELPKEAMLKKLKATAEQWQLADPDTPTLPALHYIAITAQSKPGKNGKYRLRMPFRQIDTIVSWANSIHGIVFLDVQIGQSTIEEEVNTLIPYLKLPNVHLAIDPEFAMKNGEVPGSRIGTLSHKDINSAVDILKNEVRAHNLPPKILVVHRFTKAMVTDYQNIEACPEVQVVMNMDGFGNKALKRSSYRMAIYREPVQFAGFKLFFKNDTKGRQLLYTPEELLQFRPKPIYIQYQ